jgi:CheY-like chemotaxis protein
MQLRAEPRRRILDGVRVLIVDDEEDICQIVLSVVCAYGAEGECAMSAAQARTIMARSEFDVLLSDINMPAESGYTLLRSVRQHSNDSIRSVAAAAMTARVGFVDRQQATAAGFDRIIAKPFDMTALVTSVAELAHLRSSRMTAAFG